MLKAPEPDATRPEETSGVETRQAPGAPTVFSGRTGRSIHHFPQVFHSPVEKGFRRPKVKGAKCVVMGY